MLPTPRNTSASAHPLARLRKRAGLSHAAYAQLVAAHHAELGLGTMAARREKVARWESGKVTPEPGAQLAMARLHGVSRADVLRLGWPHWLQVAGDTEDPFHAPWDAEGALRSLHALVGPLADSADRAFVICPTALARLAEAWAERDGEVRPAPTGTGPALDPLTVRTLEVRRRQIHALYLTEGAATARLLAVTELCVVGELLRSRGHGADEGPELLSAAAGAACLSGWLAYESGEHAFAQVAFVAAARLSSLAGHRQLGLWALVLMAAQCVGTGHPAQALALLEPVARVCAGPAGPGPRLASLVHLARGTARALTGEVDRALRHFDEARTEYGRPSSGGHPRFTDWFTPDALSNLIGMGLVHCGLPRRALELLGPLVTAAPADGLTPCERALAQVHMARAHLALGAWDTALTHATAAVVFETSTPTFGVRAQLEALHADLGAHLRVPAVRAYLDRFADEGTPAAAP
ncbi:helix-turn-helix domain-containing protein [Streptomyces sp. cg36]|uniref:helix-turn-helix domain-containing protein n=1 Tax=Streptomyces sp. cg36 TaxID=3238798 RepID=UPI0034E21529